MYFSLINSQAEDAVSQAYNFGKKTNFFPAQPEQWEFDSKRSSKLHLFLYNKAENKNVLPYILFQLNSQAISFPYQKGEQQSEVLRQALLKILPLDTSWGASSDYELLIRLPESLNDKAAILNLFISRFKFSNKIADLVKDTVLENKPFNGFQSDEPVDAYACPAV